MTEPFRDAVEPGPKWEFDGEVARCFDDMLERSIPQHSVMRAAVTSLALQHFRDGTDVVDLGCSRGEALAPLVRGVGRRASSFIGVEVSEPMLQAARARFFAEEQSGLVTIRALDLRREYPAAEASVTLCVLTLQFTPIEHRLRIVRDAWKSTRPGGALILVEKVIGASADIDAKMVENYYALKSVNGYTQEQIERKRLSLEGVLVPVTHDWNVDILRRAGFSEVDCFWAWMNFRGFVAVK